VATPFPYPTSLIMEGHMAEVHASGPHCSFCGQTADKVGPFVEGIGPNNEGGVFICNPCVERARALFAADPTKKETRECLRCHAVISKEAARCPQCGFPRL
jgi:hypothetical protein